MSPRPYRRGAKRDAGAELTRARIIDAAQKLLMGEVPGGFSIDAVARTADVARMTVYYQFKSKRGLLSAVFDELGKRGEMFRLREALGEAEPRVALERFVQVFVRFYNANRTFLRRLNALAVLDPELDSALSERSGWRREGLRTLLERIEKGRAGRKRRHSPDILAMVDAIMSFDTFERLASEGRTLRHVAKLTLAMVLSAIRAATE